MGNMLSCSTLPQKNKSQASVPVCQTHGMLRQHRLKRLTDLILPVCIATQQTGTRTHLQGVM